MSDNLRRYRTIRDALLQGYPGQSTGMVPRHLTTLAALISGIVGSQSTQLPKVATHVPDGAKPESRVKRLPGGSTTPTSPPSAIVSRMPRSCWLSWLSRRWCWSSMAGVGRGCVALMIHVVYKGRALPPLAWVVRRGKKGHFPEDLHIALITQVQELIPPGAPVVVLGDGECDGTDLQHTLQEAGWSYVVRTGSHVTASWQGVPFRLDTVGCVSSQGPSSRSPRLP